MRPGDHHGRQVAAVVGAPDAGDGGHAVHEGSRDDGGDVANLTGAHLLLDGDESTSKSLGVAYDGVAVARLDGTQDARRLLGVRGQGLLDEQVVSLLHCQQCRVHVEILVGGDYRSGYLGPFQKGLEVSGKEIGARVLGELLTDLLVDVAQAQPLHAGVVLRQHGPDAANGAAADDGKAYVFWFGVGQVCLQHVTYLRP